MSNVRFTKMAAAGNDFIILDNRGQRIKKYVADFSKLARAVCARKRSIGADGLLVLEDSIKADVVMRIFNPDGSEVTMCGNGSRCAASYALKNGIAKNDLSIETGAGIIKARVNGNTAKVKMTQPKNFKPKFPLSISGRVFEVSFVDTGVPHVVHFTEGLINFDVEGIGREMRLHKEFFPDGANADFVKVNKAHSISIRTYERGIESETLACGTGAVAGSVAASELYSVESPVTVKTSGGDALIIYFKKKNGRYEDVYLEGEVKFVYEGVLQA